MSASKYFKDKLALLLALILGLLGIFNTVWVMLRADLSQSSTILRYWTVQGAPEFDKQTPGQLYSFVIFTIFVVIVGWLISYKLHDLYKPAAYVVLLLSQFVLLVNIIVSGAILNLQQ